jgi:hypothetical protein
MARTQADELLGMVLAQMRLAAKGEAVPGAVNAMVNGTAVHLRMAKAEMDYAKAVGKVPNIPFLAGGVQSEK